MRLRLKGRAVLTIITMLLLFLGASMTIQHRLMRSRAVAAKSAEIDAAFLRFRNDIDAFTDNQGAKASTLAQLGAWVYELELSTPSIDAPRAAMQLALSQLRSVSDAAILGGGIWYEPFVLEADKRWVGPYAVVDGPGRAKANWEYSTDSYAYSTHDWYTIAVPASWDRARPRLRDLYMTEPYLDSLDGRPTVFITFTHVMYGPDQRIIGVATADWTLASLQHTLSEFRVTDNSLAFLVHAASGKVLFPVDRGELALVSDSAWGAHVDLSAPRQGQMVRVADIEVAGHRYDLMYTRTKADFIFGHLVATDEAYAFVRDGTRQSLWLAALTLLLVGLASLFVVSRLLRPIRELADSARMIANGDLDHTARVTTTDEVGELAIAFNEAHARARSNAAALAAAAAELEESEAHFRALIENATDIVTVIKPDGTIQYASPSLQRILGRAPADVCATKLFDYLHDDDVDDTAHAFRRLLTEHSPVESVELRLRHADGSWPHLEAILTRLDRDIVVNARDITERRRAEAALRAREAELRQAAKLEAVGRLAGGVAHDFNNALTVILGATQLLLLRHRDDPQLQATLNDVYAAGEHAASLTRQLLTFSRHHVAERSSLSLNAAVVRVESMLRRLIGEDTVFSTDLDASVTSIHADKRELEQILINLAVNARDAMPDGGTLTIRTSRAILAEPLLGINGPLDAGDYNVLSVIDTGVGMDAPTLTRVFDPFFTTKSVEAGTGLGLSTVHGIVSDSQGIILVNSSPGAGTRFHIYWPAEASEETSSTEISPSDRSRGDASPIVATVLLVEDDDSVRKISAMALAEVGFTVIEARDGVEALDLVRAGQGFDLLVTDVVMPRMKGPQLASALEELRPGLPVVFVSGYVAGELDADRVERPHYTYLQKPFTPARLCAAARRVLVAAADARDPDVSAPAADRRPPAR